MSPRSWRKGVTLIELVVVLALVGVVGGAIGTTLLRQQRFYRGAAELLGARGSVRDAMEVLSTDIRGLSVTDTAMVLADSAFEFFASIGTGLVCQTTGGAEVGLAGSGNARGNVFTTVPVQPDTGDLALFYRVAADGGDRWERGRIAAFASRALSASCPAATPFAVGSDGKGFLLSLSSPLATPVTGGTPVRFVRRGRYSLYHASDGEWYLGYRRCNAGGVGSCAVIQPLSGPYRAYSPDRNTTGLLFEYFDAEGAPIDGTAQASLTRVRITARAESHQAIPGARGWTPADSASVSIAIRNGPLRSPPP